VKFAGYHGESDNECRQEFSHLYTQRLALHQRDEALRCVAMILGAEVAARAVLT
jgi:hypothetical protein